MLIGTSLAAVAHPAHAQTADLVISPTALTMGERTESSYTVALATQPTADVTVTITVALGAPLVLGADSLVFTTSNWNMAQTVTVIATGDRDLNDETWTLTHSAADGGYDAVTKDLAVTVEDAGGAVTLKPLQTVSVDEGGSAEYTVELHAVPTGDVTVTISGHTGSDVTLSTESLTFTTANYNTAQTVTVTAGTDADLDDDTVTLTHSAADGGYDGVSADYVVTVVDDDLPGRVLVIPDPMQVDEGESLGFSVMLKPIRTSDGFEGAPTGDVTVTISGHAGSDVSLNKESFTFTSENWLTPQNGRVTAAEDADKDDDAVTLTFSAADGGFDGEFIFVDVTVADDDEVGTVRRVLPSDVLMDKAKMIVSIVDAKPASRLHWRYQALGDSAWTAGATPKGTNLPGGGDVTYNRFTFASRTYVPLTGLTAGTTYAIQFALTSDNRKTTDETPDFTGAALTKFTTTSQVMEISIADGATVADEGHSLVFSLTRHHAGEYPPDLNVNYQLDVYEYLAGSVASSPESTTTGTTLFGKRDDPGGITIPTTHDNECGEQLYARYYKVTLLDGNGYTPKPGENHNSWADGTTIDIDHRTRDCNWDRLGGI